MAPNRFLAFAGYGICTYLGVVPLTEAVLALWPFRLSETAWRFGAAGLFTQALMTPLLGLCLAAALALCLRHRAMLRFLAVLSGLVVIVILVALPLFVLDAMAVRALVDEGSGQPLNTASASAVLKMSATVLIAGAVALGGWRASRSSGSSAMSPGITFKAGKS